MPATFDRELRRLLTRAGCTLVRMGKGSHEIWHSPVTKRRFPVPVGIVSHTGWLAESLLKRLALSSTEPQQLGINGAGRNIR